MSINTDQLDFDYLHFHIRHWRAVPSLSYLKFWLDIFGSIRLCIIYRVFFIFGSRTILNNSILLSTCTFSYSYNRMITLPANLARTKIRLNPYDLSQVKFLFYLDDFCTAVIVVYGKHFFRIDEREKRPAVTWWEFTELTETTIMIV